MAYKIQGNLYLIETIFFETPKRKKKERTRKNENPHIFKKYVAQIYMERFISIDNSVVLVQKFQFKFSKI